MHTTDYYDSFIQIADDCPVLSGEVPQPKNDKPTVASRQYEMIVENPYRYTSDDVIFTIHAERNGLEANDQNRAAFFAKGQPCLRSSPLAKRYGWGIHSNAQGKVAIYAAGSEEYQKLAKDGKLKQIKAMRSSRG